MGPMAPPKRQTHKMVAPAKQPKSIFQEPEPVKQVQIKSQSRCIKKELKTVNEMRHYRAEKDMSYKILSHQERLDIIYEHIIHKRPMRAIAKNLRQRYTTVRTIIKSYE